MKVLVTGAAGYVGALLTAELLSDGHDVTALDNGSIDSLLHLMADDRLSVIRADIRDTAALYKAAAGADLVYHLAAISGMPACDADPGEAVSVNVDGTRNVVAALAPGQCLCYASTTSIYGPPTLYARTKEQAEGIVMQRANSIAIRWATLFGVSPRMRHDLLPNALVQAAVQRGHVTLFSPDQRRTFMHVSHAASDYAWIPERWEEMVGRVWDVGDSGLTCSKRHLVAQIQEFVPCECEVAPEPDKDQRDLYVDFSAAAMLGLGTPATQWRNHIPELVRLYRAMEVRA